jgi:regulator of replication initiation timing
MEKQEIYSKVVRLEERLGELHREMDELKHIVVALLEENGQLRMENEHLRKRFEQKTVGQADALDASPAQTRTVKRGKGKIVGEGYDNLARLYAEGFHICPVHYGAMRKEGEEDCLFCFHILSGVAAK